MQMRVGFALLCACWMGMADAQSAPPTWMATDGAADCHVEGAGDPWNKPGATLHIASVAEDAGKSGAVGSASDAMPFRNRKIKLEADLSTQGAEKGATLYLTVYGPRGKLDFISTGRLPVRDNQQQVHRAIELAVPSIATRLLYGLAISGQGTASAEHLRLLPGDTVKEVPPKVVLDTAIDIVRKNALHANDVDWKTVEPQIRAMAADARVPQETYPAIRVLLKSLGDHHSFFETAAANTLLSAQGGALAAPVVKDEPGRIGYIAMPGYDGGDVKAQRTFAENMVNDIARVAPQASCGWIVDLRNDEGGNMYPMLAGLRPLLGTATLGSFRDAQGKLIRWRAGDEGVKALKSNALDLGRAKVAVLTGPHTASSGEAVVVAFHGRDYTRSFGEPTGGLSTANRVFSLPDDSKIVLTTSVDVDRNGHIYGDKIQPDQLIHADGSEGDVTLTAASQWLTTSCSANGLTIVPANTQRNP